ncbi:MAG: VOC family protein [Hyphomicrobiales bacterium]|nr:VOC family protein [Hyphomicrobiales bacterium]
MDRATQFYQRLGWRRSQSASNESISFFSLNNIVLALFGADSLAEDSGLGAAAAAMPADKAQSSNAIPGQARIVLAQNHPSQSAVRAAMSAAMDAGAQVLIEPQDTFWGGYHGVFADPDGHVWELSYNPFFPLAADGTVELPA